jgi:RNA polymerase sigma-70 factor (ECF subfamily)
VKHPLWAAIFADHSSNPHDVADHDRRRPIDELLPAVRRGEEDAAAELVEQLYPLVLKIVRSYRAPRTSEEDLCQMIYVRIFHNLHQYAGAAPLEHWVSRLAVNSCLKQIEKERARPELRYADLSAEQARMVEELATTAQEIPTDDGETARELITELLQRLKPKERLIVSLLHLEGRSVAEIRALTGWGTASIKVRAFRARQKLKRLYHQLARHFL